MVKVLTYKKSGLNLVLGVPLIIIGMLASLLGIFCTPILIIGSTIVYLISPFTLDLIYITTGWLLAATWGGTFIAMLGFSTAIDDEDESSERKGFKPTTNKPEFKFWYLGILMMVLVGYIGQYLYPLLADYFFSSIALILIPTAIFSFMFLSSLCLSLYALTKTL